MVNIFGLIDEKPEQPKFPILTLVRVPHQGGSLIVTRKAFGQDTFRKNVAKMKENYCYPNTREVITCKESTTAESISAVDYNFETWAKPEIFDPSWLQAGWAIKTSEGVYVNPPKDANGDPIIDEKILKSLRDKSTKLEKGVYILENGKVKGARDFGYVSYESFTRGIQEAGTFAEGGLARILEHTNGKKAEKLGKIASYKDYVNGVNVWGFDDVREPLARVVSLDSGGYGSRLGVGGDDWGDYGGGCASGVLTSTEGAKSTQKN